MPGTLTRQQGKTWARATDLRGQLRLLRSSIRACETPGYEPLVGSVVAALADLDRLEETLGWFVEAAEERDRLLPPTCTECHRTIEPGTGISRNGRLTPLCPVCQSHALLEVLS